VVAASTKPFALSGTRCLAVRQTAISPQLGEKFPEKP
jgi:hypothetical protein